MSKSNRLEWLIEHIRRGLDLSVSRLADERRKIVFRDSAGKPAGEMELARDDYETLMQSLALALVAEHGKALRVEIKRDFYGQQWIEVRTGMLGLRTARLGLSPRHVNAVHTGLVTTVTPPTADSKKTEKPAA